MANLSNINDKFLVTTGGNVLIGQTSAVGSSILQVTGTNHIVTFKNTSTTANTYAQLLIQAGDATNYIWTAAQNSTNWAGSRSLNIYTAQTGANIGFFTEGDATNTKLMILGNGNVGIGTDSPDKKLEILSTASNHLRLAYSETAFWDLFQNAADGSFRILKDNGSLFTFAQSGNLGIGVTPNFALQVSGSNKNIQLGEASTVTTTDNLRHIFSGSAHFIGQDSLGEANIGNNAYYNSGFKRRNAGLASNIRHNAGNIYLQTAASAAINTAITWINALTIIPSGKVGIGTTSPQQLLHINEAGNTTKPGIQVQGGVFGFTLGKAPQSADYVHLKPLGSGISVLRVMPNTSSSTSYIEAWGTDYEADTSNWNRIYMNVTGSSGNATITTDSSGTGAVGNLYLGTNSNQQTLTILDSGNVGIGTTTPDYTFTVLKSITNDWLALFGNTYNGAGNGVLIDAGNGSSGEILRLRDRNGNSKVSFLSNGNVGIGTTAPQAALTVAHDLSNGGDATGFRLNAATSGTSNTLFGGPVSSGDYAFFQSYKEGASAGVRNLNLNPIGGNVGIGTDAPGQKLEVAGLVKHQGLDMTAGVQVDQTTSITKTLTGTANVWRPTGIDGTDIPSTGSYLLQVFSDDHSGAGPANYSWFWTGTMSWYAGPTNNNVTSEIYLNGCGHHTNMVLELRTKVNYNSATIPFPELEWKSGTSFVNSPGWIFKFRRLM